MGQVADIHAELIGRCRNGDRRAQSEIFRLYAKPMFNISMRILNDRVIAEDVLQDCFVKVFQNLDSFRQEATFGSWIKRIVINHSLNEVKKKRYRFVDIDDQLIEEPQAVEEECLYNIHDIHDAVYELAEGFRVVFTLYMFEDMSHKEIAAQLGISESTSKSQLSRARKQIRQILMQRRNGRR